MATNITKPNYVNPYPQPKIYIKTNSGWSTAGITGFIFLMILWFMIIQFVIYKINKYRKSKVINDWWKNRGGAKYNTCFNTDLINEFNSMEWIYELNKMFFGSAKEAQLTYKDIDFLDNNVMPHIFVQSKTGSLNQGKETQSNFVWPEHMCKSILFEKGEDYLYDQYLSSGEKGYPDGNSQTDWRNLIQKWCGPDSGAKWTNMPESSELQYIDSKNINTSKLEWMSFEKHPDNVFARYGIRFDSALITSICNDKLSGVKGSKLNHNAALSLIGSKSGGGVDTDNGGWMGYLLNLDESDPTDFIYTSLTTGAPSGNMLGSGQDGSGGGAKKCSGGDITSSVMSGIGGTVGIAAMAVFAPEALPFIALGALFSGAAAGVGSAASSGCL